MKKILKTLYFFSLIAMLAPISSIAQTGWYSCAETTDLLHTVFFIDSLNGWVGGTLSPSEVGVIRRTTDGGDTWVIQTIPVTDFIKRIVFLTPEIGFAVGGNGSILKTTNAGVIWIQKESGTYRNLNSIFFIDNQVGWACGADTVLLTINQGETWSARSVSAISHVDISFRNCQEGWVVGLYEGCYKSTDGGDSWNSIDAPISGRSLLGICFPSSSKGIVIGGEQIALTTNGGESWSSVYNSGGSQLNSVSFADSLNGWVAGSDKIVKTTNGGSTWFEQPWQPYRDLTAVHSTDQLHAWAVGDQLILKTKDGGGITSIPTLKNNLPNSPKLYQNYPNPFNPTTHIDFEIPKTSYTTLEIFNLIGKKVATLVDKKLHLGPYSVSWNALGYSSGLYFYTLNSGDFIVTKKLLLLK